MDRRKKLLTQLWDAQNKAYDLMSEYDELPHCYGEHVLYQAEGNIAELVAIHPGTTVTDLSVILKKTPSACSQIVRKLVEKGFVEQIRNPENNRQYNLWLTEKGQDLYRKHQEFNHLCQMETYRLLEGFTEEELEHHVRVQQKINEAYQCDICRSQVRIAQAKSGE